ncbi:D-hexose-6-phosphate mutarotase [Methylobacillus gramineus]|uniref:D-hexose-6-phosphate mutarotase n=1 Tax=Methylobacillus gramineus TaxID=755169 RepID=UPI001CFF5644|nr:D-hexose-6-phosphate mutarotase [Methylobacillus gramineus]MCB5185356.1 D-hexose-6-phosphate mutarotase [Methylobacillus gramineus]
MQSIHELNARYGVGHKIQFSSDLNGLVTLDIENPHATAKVALQGGHVMQWNPRHAEAPVLWLSDQARFVSGRSIRGGVPVCWPWFGPHPTDETLCPHGFARVVPWEVVDAKPEDNNTTSVVMRLAESRQVEKQWPYLCDLTLTINIGPVLKMALSTTNNGDVPFVIGEALHTYFQVSDIEVVKITGLDHAEYEDKVEDYALKRQFGDISFSDEVDRVYLHTESTCVLEDPGLRRKIIIEKSGSSSTVVWTPWERKAAEIGDLGSHYGWRQMVCVESSNVRDNAVTVAPGETHVLTVQYSTEGL